MDSCLLCTFWNGERCIQTWRLTIHITPTGGQVDVQTTPGMVPEELKEKFTRYFQRFLEKVLPAIDMMPIWDEIREYQLAHTPVTETCPGRQIKEDIKPYLKIVR